MKDIYINMNTQNILKYYGTKFDLKLDHSEFYDYELGNNEIDYNVDILNRWMEYILDYKLGNNDLVK